MKNHIETPCDAKFKKLVLTSCYEALAAIGFNRFRKENVDWPLNVDFHCWVGLNSGLYAECVQINPFVGVHVASIDKHWASIKIGKYPSKYNRGVATYAIHLGLLTPREKVFEFARDTDIKQEAARLAQLYLDVGLPYAKSIASYESLLPLMQERIDMLGAYPERVASCLYLMGKIEEAREFTESFLAKNKDYFEGFAIPFLQMLNSECKV